MFTFGRTFIGIAGFRGQNILSCYYPAVEPLNLVITIMSKRKFRNREERRTYMAQRYMEMRKQIPWAGGPTQFRPSGEQKGRYRPGFFTRIRRLLVNILTVYPRAIAAGVIAVIAYLFFRQANGITQWAGGVAISTLAIANPEASIKVALKTHDYMTSGVSEAGEILREKPREP